MIESVVIYRSSDRPKYVEKSLRHLLENTSPDTALVFFDNSSPENIEAVERAVEKAIASAYAPQRRATFHYEGKRIGGPNAIIKGLTQARACYSELKYILVVDDDVLVPMPEHAIGDMRYWDTVLVNMMKNGWDIVAHPWDYSFRGEYEKIGDAVGHRYGGVGGGCSGFTLELFDRHPIYQQTKIRGYNEWMNGCSQKGANTGYSGGYMVISHFDRPEHPWSLRDTEYDDWSNDMFYERFPNAKKEGKIRPKGKQGVW